MLTTNLIQSQQEKNNSCRIYLRITFLSEVCNPEVASLNITLLQNKATNQVNSRFWWPNQTKPGAKYWTDWISYLLKHIVYRVHIIYNNNTNYANGWMYITTATVTPTLISPSLQEVYNTKPITRHYCEHTGAGTHSIIPNTSACIDTIPVDAIPITLTNNIFNCTVQS